MRGLWKGRQGLVVAGLATLMGSAIATARAQSVAADRSPEPLAVTLRDDAALLAANFVNATEGWVVGERGVIWHTHDAGTTWQQQDSRVACALRGVFFLDPMHGWAVGGETKPFGQGTAGVVLQTVDGGATWTALPTGGGLPAVKGVRFFTAAQGIAYGAAGALFPSGVYVTKDGGQSWQAAACDATGSEWQAGDFLDSGGGAVAGAGGRFATFAAGEVRHSPLSAGSLRTLRAMRLLAPTGGWAVGDGGFVATTNDAGRSWQMPAGALPDRGGEQFDFQAVAVMGPQVWIAGAPGSRVFHSQDAGQTWEARITGETAPLRALAFADAEHGWAVGELGTIVSTQDGGRTWRTQRSGGRRAALLAVFAKSSDVPLEVLAQEGAAEGYLAAVNVLFRADGSTGSVDGRSLDATGIDEAREAFLLAGATAAEIDWQFPLADGTARDATAAMDVLNRANDGRAAGRLVGELVRQLRTWRPDVIVTHAPEGDDSPTIGGVVSQLVLQAVEGAGDSERFSELGGVGLEAWQVKRVYGLLPSSGRGQETVATGQFMPQLGVTLADWSAAGRRLLSAGESLPPAATSWCCSRIARATSGRGATVCSAGSCCRRGATVGAGWPICR